MLEVQRLTVTYGAVTALRGINLDVRKGEIVVLTGEPGAGKTALIRSIAGDAPVTAGEITIAGKATSGTPAAAERLGVAVVWQDLALCDNLDIAGNLLLGRETPRLLRSQARFHAAAAELLADLQIKLPDTAVIAGELPSGQRRLLALAMALSRRPAVLALDEPTAALGGSETADVERLLRAHRERGVAVLLATRDIGQMFRLADRIVVLRGGEVVAELDPRQAHPDDVAALLAGQRPDASARNQLTRLHGLAESLALAEPSSGLTLIIAALAAALGIDRSQVEITPASKPLDEPSIAPERWAFPVIAGSVHATLTVIPSIPEKPNHDELDLLALYAGYAAAAIERLQAESAQREAAALRRSRELQRQFLSRLSHELRTPLTAIRGYASSLAAPDVVWDGESQQRFLERIAAESARLGRLVDDLLDFSAIESGVMRLQRDWCDLPLVIEAAVACLPPEWAANVATGVAGELPPIWADHDRLEQVCVNLLTNAMRHNPPGTSVTVTAAEAPVGCVTLSIADDGAGFPPALRKSPFDSNPRVRSRTAGAGLGLSITRGIVSAHGGTIELLDRAPGTTFEIRLPIEAPAPSPTEPTEPTAQPVKPPQLETAEHA